MAPQNPETAGKARSVASQVEYLYHVLTGERAVSRCTASGTGLFNIHSLDWDEGLLQFVGLSREQLGELEEVFHVGSLKASIAQAVGLKPGTPVTVGAADGAMNQLRLAEQTMESCRSLWVPAVPCAWSWTRLGFPNSHPHGATICTASSGWWGAATNGATNCVDWFLDRCGNSSNRYADYDRAAATVDVEAAPIFCPSSTVNAVQVGRRTGQEVLWD